MDSASIVDAVKHRRYNRRYCGRIARIGGEFLDNNPN
ncbi:hypothetical protein A2U01_0059357, partial [Trifolium medium]|nr:hypothetical protein [Trifolium medium]